MSVGPGEDVAFGRGLWSGDDEEPDQRGGGASNDEEGHGEGGVLSPQACEGAMEPAATHWVKPRSAVTAVVRIMSSLPLVGARFRVLAGGCLPPMGGGVGRGP